MYVVSVVEGFRCSEMQTKAVPFVKNMYVYPNT